MDTIKIGFIGLGGRGMDLLKYCVLSQNKEVSAVCDVYEDRTAAGVALVKAETGTEPKGYLNYEEVLADPNVNTVIIATAWETHIEIAVKAMESGKAVAMEVAGAYTLEDCFRLVDTYEKTKMPFMFLENCCFDRREMMILNMVQQGVFGEVVHCAGGYQHDLREEITGGRENRHYRLRNYLSRNCENYPTHELGPIAKILNINRGNRMLTLSSTASKACGLRDYVQKKRPDDPFFQGKTFAQGDVVTTVIKCAGGETITLTLDTTLPRYYCRNFTVRGSNAMYEEATDSIFMDGTDDYQHDYNWRSHCIGNAKNYEEKYEHPIWKQYLKDGLKHGHGGIDYLEFQIFFDALESGKPMPVDVYDAAAWMSVSVLSEMSIARGGAVVDIPDFTRGKWQMHLAD